MKTIKILMFTLFIILMSSFVSAITPDGLTSYWDMDIGVDDMHYMNNDNASVECSVGNTNGAIGNSTLCGSGESIILNQNLTNIPVGTDFSICAWFNMTQVPAGTNSRPFIWIGEATTVSPTGATIGFINNDDASKAGVLYGHLNNDILGSDQTTANIWQFECSTYDSSGTFLQAWLDGEYWENTTVTMNLAREYMSFGSRGEGVDINSAFKIDEVSIWNRTLSRQDIADLYNSGDALDYDNILTGGVDSTPPTFTDISENQTFEFFYDNIDIDFNATDETSFSNFFLNGTTDFNITWSDGQLTNTSILSVGEYSFLVSINDTAGNYDYINVTLEVQDTIPPNIDAYPNNHTLEFGIDALFTDINASDPSGLNATPYRINDTTNFTINAEGNIENVTVGRVGEFHIEVSATDAYNNTNSTYIIVTIQDTTFPYVDLVYPTNTIYSENISNLNYTCSDTSLDSCWYSIDGGATNSSPVSAGTNFTDIPSFGGNNNWTVYCNDTSNNENSTSINFTLNNLWYNPGYSYANNSFRITEFIKVNGTNFTLANQPYKIIGANFYYAIDYMTNFTYSDNGEEITGSESDVYEVLNEMQYLGINVVRTWGLMQGGNDAGTNATWERDTKGGHYNFAINGYPEGYNETFFLAFDKFLYECSKRDIRPQITLVNNWEAYGGMSWYLSMSGTSNKTYEDATYLSDNWKTWHDQFYTDAEANEYFQNAINYTLNRNNTYTGVLYKDDPTIFSWMIANEPRAVTSNHSIIANWCNDTATFIKNIDSNHLVTCGIEALGFNETWGEGSNILTTYNNTASDYATFAMNTGQWGYMVERVETSNDGVYMCEVSSSNCGLGNANVRAFWAYGYNYTYNSLWNSNLPLWTPKLARHSYDNWVEQNVEWANEIGKPVMLQEMVIDQSYSDVTKDDVYLNAISNFYSKGGDGIMLWTMNSDSYYRASDTSSTGNQDDGYGFYLSDNETLKALSASSINAIENASSWTTSLNSYKYDFVVNIGIAGSVAIDNCSLVLNVSNGTVWSDDYIDQSNTTPIIDGIDYVFTKQFNSTSEEVYWLTRCYGNGTSYDTSTGYILLQTGVPIVELISPDNLSTSNNSSVSFNYNVTDTLDINNCGLYLDGVLNSTDTTITKETTQTFIVDDISNGNHLWYVKCTDVDSNIDNSEIRNFTVDTIFPSATISLPLNNTLNLNNSMNFTANLTDDQGIRNATFYLYNETDLVNETTENYVAGTTTAFFSTLVENLLDGIYSWWVSIWDWADNEAISENYTLNIDTAYPTANLNVTPHDMEAGIEQVWINATCSDLNGISQMNYNLTYPNGSIETESIGVVGDTLQYYFTSSVVGIFNVSIYCNDTFGLVTENTTYINVSDTIYPLIEFNAGTENNYTNFSRDWIYSNVSWTEVNFKNITWNINGTEYPNESQIYNYNATSIGEGTYFYNVTICDAGGNCNSTETRQITLDTTAPIINITEPTGTYTSTTVNLKVTADSEIDTWWYNLNSGANTIFTPNTTITGVSGGNNIIVYGNDSVGNVGNETSNFIISLPDGGSSGGSSGVIVSTNLTGVDIIEENETIRILFEGEDNPLLIGAINIFDKFLNDYKKSVNSVLANTYVDPSLIPPLFILFVVFLSLWFTKEDVVVI